MNNSSVSRQSMGWGLPLQSAVNHQSIIADWLLPVGFHPPAGFHLPPAGFRLLASIFHLLASTCWLPSPAYWLLPVGFLIPPTGCCLLASTSSLSTLAGWLSAAGFHLPPAGFHLLASFSHLLRGGGRGGKTRLKMEGCLQGDGLKPVLANAMEL